MTETLRTTTKTAYK